MTIINASDRTYVRAADGSLRVLDYEEHGVEGSDIYETQSSQVPAENPTN